MVKNSIDASEKAKERILIGILLVFGPFLSRSFGLDNDLLVGMIYALTIPGWVFLIIGIVGLTKNPKR